MRILREPFLNEGVDDGGSTLHFLNEGVDDGGSTLHFLNEGREPSSSTPSWRKLRVEVEVEVRILREFLYENT